MVIPSLISQDLQTINEYVRSSKKEDSTGPKRNLLASLYSSPQPHPELSLSSLANLTKRHIPQTSSLISTQSGEMLGNLVHKISAAQSTATLRPTTSDSPPPLLPVARHRLHSNPSRWPPHPNPLIHPSRHSHCTNNY